MDDDRVAGVVATGEAGDDVEFFAEDVDDLALAFIAPLGPKNDGGRAAKRARRGFGSRGRLLRGDARGKCAQRASRRNRSRP